MQNVFIGEGNLGSSASVKQVKVKYKGETEERPVVEMSVRFPVQRKVEGGFEDTKGFWAKVTWWGKLAEQAAKMMKTGTRVLVVGEQSLDSFTAAKGEREGQQIDVIELDAKHVGIVPMCIESLTLREKKPREKNNDEREETAGA